MFRFSFGKLSRAFLKVSLLVGVVTLPGNAGASVRLSFLADPAVRQETLELLEHSGCPEETTRWFRRAVEGYHATCCELGSGKFPSPEAGSYTFSSVDEIIRALPHPLCETVHHFDLNCFDTIIALTWGQLRSRLVPDQDYGSFLAPHLSTNGAWSLKAANTPRQAFGLCYPEWYREQTEPAFPQPMADLRMVLTAGLFAGYDLPSPTRELKLPGAVLEELRKNWRRQGFGFPEGVQVVLCHEVNFPKGWFVTAHAGLLIPRPAGFTYIEKAGGSGPFVRLDFMEAGELLLWLAQIFKDADQLGYTHHFATFNDREIRPLEPIAKSQPVAVAASSIEIAGMVRTERVALIVAGVLALCLSVRWVTVAVGARRG